MLKIWTIEVHILSINQKESRLQFRQFVKGRDGRLMLKGLLCVLSYAL